MSDWGRVQFRAWLQQKVLDSQNLARVCCVAVHQGRVGDVAEKMGLHPSLVEEIGLEYARRVVASGRAPPTGKKVDPSVYPQLTIKMPRVAYDAWCALAERLHMRPSMALRALVHEYLLGTEEPRHKDTRWVIDGRVASGIQVDGLHPAITNGAFGVFNTRAARLGLSHAELLRALMVDAIAGHRRIRAPIQRAAMYDDPKRYRV